LGFASLEIDPSQDNEILEVCIDNERAAAGAPLDAFVKVRKRLRFVDCRLFERRAIENCSSETVVERFKGESYRALGT
jgi:hypothetical protein